MSVGDVLLEPLVFRAPTYIAYPDQVYRYLKDNVRDLPRTVFRYAVEKARVEVKRELVSL